MPRVRMGYSHWNQKAMRAEGWSAEQTEAQVKVLRERLEGSLSVETIFRNGLDNPMMSEDARKVLLNAVKRDRAARERRKAGV